MSIISSRTIHTKNGHELVIRSAISDDAAILVDMVQTILQENNFNITTTEEFRFTVDQEMEWLEDVTETPGHLALVAEYDYEPVGLLNFHVDPRKRMKHHGNVSININALWRNQGIGRAMLQTLIDWAQNENGLEKIMLEVFVTNTRAITLYRSLGFQQEGHLLKQIKMAPNVYVDVLLMGLWLNKPASEGETSNMVSS